MQLVGGHRVFVLLSMEGGHRMHGFGITAGKVLGSIGLKLVIIILVLYNVTLGSWHFISHAELVQSE